MSKESRGATAVPDTHLSSQTAQRPDPSRAATPEQLVAQLNQLRVWAGRPSFRVLRDLAGARLGTGEPAAEALPVSTTHEVLAGKRLPRLPRLDFVESFVCACLRAAHCPPEEIEAEVERWRDGWRSLARSQAGADPRAEAGRPPPAPAPVPARRWRLPRPGRRTAVLIAAAVVLTTAGGVAGAAAVGSLDRGLVPAGETAQAPARPAFPDGHNTGVPPGTPQVVHLGDLVVNRPGAVVSGLLVVGRIIVAAPGVTIRGTRVVATLGTGGAEPCRCGVLQSTSAPDLLVEDTEIAGGTAEPIEYGIAGRRSGLTVRRANISAVEVGVAVTSDSIVEDSYLHDLVEVGHSPGGVYSAGGDKNVVVRRNTILNPHDSGAAVLFYVDSGVMSHVLVEGNLLGGGGYAIYPGIGMSGNDIRVVGNRFSRAYFPRSGVDGPVDGWNPQVPGNLWRDNAWQDTGQSVPPE
jgi:hypothetical protein